MCQLGARSRMPCAGAGLQSPSDNLPHGCGAAKGVLMGMTGVLWVALGGALGSSARYLASRWLGEAATGSYPWGTFTVNVVGCLLIGLLTVALQRSGLGDGWKLLLVTGFCGGFTTFSTFASENLALMRASDWLVCAAYVTLSLWLGIAAVWLGTKLGGGV